MKNVFKYTDYKYYGFIYITTNLINGKRYIGQKKINRNWKNYLGSGIVLQKAIQKYGKENFSRIIIDFAYSYEELNKKEIEYIQLYDAVKNPNFYNCQEGGDCPPCTDETKEKIRQAHIGLFKGENHPMYGKHHSPETLEKIRNNSKGRIAYNKGVPMSEEQKQKLKVSRQRVPVRRHKMVRCIETGKVYYSAAEANVAMGVYEGSINRVCRGERATCCGYHWEYVKEI